MVSHAISECGQGFNCCPCSGRRFDISSLPYFLHPFSAFSTACLANLWPVSSSSSFASSNHSIILVSSFLILYVFPSLYLCLTFLLSSYSYTLCWTNSNLSMQTVNFLHLKSPHSLSPVQPCFPSVYSVSISH